MTVRLISMLYVLGKVLPETSCPKCSEVMRLRGNDDENHYYHECSNCGHKVIIDTNSGSVKKFIANYRAKKP